ncbi:MAG: ABC transporter permease [Candidatus Poseidoniaceae archaeon]|nr:ABC transporter permease [Candidatus Poseidoniaceae archaeon]MDP7000415.1 ABC transporter permease [Candidatus Poseidoniaceae archaeon]
MNVNRIYAIAARKFATLKRDHRTFAFIIIMPAIQILLFGIAIGQPPTGLDVAIVSNDQVDIDENFSTMLSQSDTFVIHNEYNSSESVRTAIAEGDLWAAITFSDSGVVEIHLDNSNQQVSSTILIEVRNALTDIMAGKGVALPLEVTDPIYGDRDPAFIDFLAPGIMTLVCFMFSLILTTMAFVGERHDGTLDRVFAAGVQPSEVLIGHMAAFTTILIGQVSTVMIIAIYGFDIPLNGNPLTVFLLAMFLGWAAMCIGMFISTKASSEFQAVQLNMPMLFLALLISGILWPVEALPAWLQPISWGLPTTWTAEAFRSIMIRGWGFEKAIVAGSFVYNMVFSIIMLFVAAKSLKTQD